MKKLLFYFIFFNAIMGFGQDKTFSIGYFGHGVIRPGVNLGLSIPLNTLDPQKEKSTTFLINPQIGWYGRPNFYSSYLAIVDAGIKRQKIGKRIYMTYAIGAGYLAHYEVKDFLVDFNGKKSNKNRELKHYFMPSLSTELGFNILERMGMYTKITFGQKLSPNLESSGNIFLEAGLTFSLSK